MYTEPEIVNPSQLSSRGYVKVYINGKRVRFYNGKTLDIICNPNHCKSLTDRSRALRELSHRIRIVLTQGWTPSKESSKGVELVLIPSTKEAFETLLISTGTENLSQLYQRNLHAIMKRFMIFLEKEGTINNPATEVTGAIVTRFLVQYRSSGTNYMNARRTLAALFTRLVKDNTVPVNPVIRTTKMKQSAHANIPYSRTQLRLVMDQTKAINPHLYLCCLLTYGTFLRPHQEIRLLTRSAFNDDMSVITLWGNRDKSRRMRTVPVPDYVRQRLLHEDLGPLSEDCNIFTRCITPYNMSYFSTAWTRLKTTLVEQQLITANHTLYSFRHTAAVNMYLKTKDPFKIQRAMGHSTLTVTLTYLRSLGVMVDSSLDDLPEL